MSKAYRNRFRGRSDVTRLFLLTLASGEFVRTRVMYKINASWATFLEIERGLLKLGLIKSTRSPFIANASKRPRMDVFLTEKGYKLAELYKLEDALLSNDKLVVDVHSS